MNPRSPSRRLGRLLLALVALTLIIGASSCSSGGTDEATPLPKADLRSLETGKAADWPAEGRPMVVNFWASWCTPCRAEMPDLEKVHQQLGDRVAIVGVTDDDRAKAVKAADDAGVTYPLLLDEGQTLLTDLEVAGLPGTVFVDADGQVIGRHLGALTDDELIAEIEDRYDITV